jgi:hypothetical protein
MEKNQNTEVKPSLKNYEIQLNNAFKEYYKGLLNFNSHTFEDYCKKSLEKLPITFRVNKLK